MMVDQTDFPNRWACTSESKRVAVELRIPQLSGYGSQRSIRTETRQVYRAGVGVQTIEVPYYEWVEIPTTNVEHWDEKGEAAEIQRTTRVEFPTEWGRNSADIRHNSPRQLVDRFTNTNTDPYLIARVRFKDASGDWILKHFGWIGGVGATSQANVSKMWVYDFAEFLTGVPIGETFNNPQIDTALENIAKLTNNNTPIPLSEVLIIPPDSEDEYKILSENYAGERSLIGAPQSEIDDDIKYSYYSLDTGEITNKSPTPDEVFGDDAEFITLPSGSGENFTAIRINTGNTGIYQLDGKSFTSNRDTLLDIYQWFEEKTGAKLQFEPRSDSVALVADIIPERRTFSHDAVINKKIENDELDYRFHQDVSVLNNDALYEMKPINTLNLRGSAQRGWLDGAVDVLESSLSMTPFAEPPSEDKYPIIKVQSPALLDAAEGVELAGKVVESDAHKLDTAEREATRKLSKEMEESGEGQIVVTGTPRMLPFDRLDAFEVCDKFVEYEQKAVKYELESVKHHASGTEPFKSILNVSIWVNDKNIKTVKKTMAAVDDSEQAELVESQNIEL